MDSATISRKINKDKKKHIVPNNDPISHCKMRHPSDFLGVKSIYFCDLNAVADMHLTN